MAEKTDTDEGRSSSSFQVPQFAPKIPDELMEQWHSLEPVLKAVLREQSVQGQRIEWIMARCTIGCPALSHLPQMSRDLEQIKKLRDTLTAKWSVVAFLVISLLMPAFMLWLGKQIK